MKKYLLSIACFFVLSAFSSSLFAQYNTPSKREFGVSIGTVIYRGDLGFDWAGYVDQPKPTLALSMMHGINSTFGLRTNLMIGSLHADEAKLHDKPYRQSRGLAFSTPLAELSELLLINPIGNEARFYPYFMIGAGASLVDIRRDWSRSKLPEDNDGAARLDRDIAHNTPTILPVLPMGGGLRYQITSSWAVNSEFMYRFTASDYLDGFQYATNNKGKDSYYGLSIGVSYRFCSNFYDCPNRY